MTAAGGVSDAERRLQRSSAAHASWANTPDRTARNAAARAAWEAKFERIVDPEGLMSPEARRKAAESAIKAHYREMARRSLASRRRASAAAQAT